MGYVKRREIEALEPREEPPTEVLGWVPVSERLPEEFATVLVVISTPSGSHVSFMSRHAQDGFWQHADGDIDEINVTHWMPLPEPPAA